MLKQQSNQPSALKIFALILLGLALLGIYKGYENKETFLEVYFNHLWYFVAWLFMLMVFLLWQGYMKRVSRQCVKCKKNIRTYKNTVYTMRWNSGRTPTALFFCLKCGNEILKKPYSKNLIRGDEDRKGQKELYGEMKSIL